MSIRFTSETAGLEARIAGKGEEVVSSVGERGALRVGRTQPDFNPLMERVLRAQRIAERQMYVTSYQE